MPPPLPPPTQVLDCGVMAFAFVFRGPGIFSFSPALARCLFENRSLPSGHIASVRGILGLMSNFLQLCRTGGVI